MADRGFDAMKAEARYERWVDRGAHRVSPRVVARGRGLRRDARTHRDVVRDYDEWIEHPAEHPRERELVERQEI